MFYIITVKLKLTGLITSMLLHEKKVKILVLVFD